jgi:4-carboxymuconolactone decarboxylase
MNMTHSEAFTARMPALERAQMNEAQRAAADELIAGPRRGVTGPFIALLRSPELMGHLQKVGEFLRFRSSLPPRLSEFATLVVARHWAQQFEWQVHRPLALQAGVAAETLAALREGRRPSDMNEDEALIHDFLTELNATKGVSDATYEACRARIAETGVVELTALAGYFSLVSMVLNVAHIPAGERGEPLPLLPL